MHSNFDLPGILDLPGRPQDNRVVVAMSGGVDSTVVAALLARAGYEVVGVTLQLYDHGAAVHRAGACCAGQDIHDARRAADSLGIAHYVLDYEERFKSTVIDSFAASYAAGETPIPCVECNRQIKFRDLLDTAEQLGAAALATGHYVQSRAVAGGGRGLFRGQDEDRDQSYFLWATTPHQLARLRFPLGGLSKAETRALAREFGLAVADKSDSQDICFVPSGHYADLVERLQPDAAEPGDIVDLTGRVVGRHRGIMRYTVGQRRGLGIVASEPLFVVRLDAARRQVVVGPRSALATRTFTLRELNWIGDEALSAGTPVDVAVKVRSTRRPQPGALRALPGGGAEIVLHDAEEGVAPGQACVFYAGAEAGARMLGGGVIAAAAPAMRHVAPTQLMAEVSH
jgi:tRNA-specific 2-thiouridylase